MVRQVKKKIPKALREAVWIRHVGRKFEAKCMTAWCQNIMTVFDFQTSHDIPESKGGPMTLDNLFPLCGRCNQSMGNQYTFSEWTAGPIKGIIMKRPGFFRRCFGCFMPSSTVAPEILSPSTISTNPVKSLRGKSPKSQASSKESS